MSFFSSNHTSQFGLLKERRFAPLFGVQYFSAFNDNLYKNALVVMIAYGFLEAGSFTPVLTTLSWGIFILPFLLFSSLAGEIANTFEKSHLIRWIKGAEVLILTLATLGLFMKSIFLLYAGLFLMGAHATFFLPTKYSLLAHHLKPSEFLGGTGLMEGITFLGVFLGNLLGGFLILEDPSAFLFLLVAFCAAFIGLGLSFFIPFSPTNSFPKTPSPNLKILLKKPLSLLWTVHDQKKLFFVILGISWFWSYEGTFLSQIPTLIKTGLILESKAVTFFLLLFSMGTMSGAFVCNKLLKGIPSARLVPFTLFLLSLFMADFVQSIHIWQNQEFHQLDLSFFVFLQTPLGARILFDFSGIALGGGICIVPLYAILQSRTSPQNCSRVFALNNVVNAIFMVGWSLFIMVLFFLEVSLLNVFLLISGMNGLLAVFTWSILKTAYGQRVLDSILNKLLKGPIILPQYT